MKRRPFFRTEIALAIYTFAIIVSSCCTPKKCTTTNTCCKDKTAVVSDTCKQHQKSCKPSETKKCCKGH